MKGFLVGLGVGVGIGMLFAPMRGEDVRVMASVRASELADTARETYDNLQGTVDKMLTFVRGEEGDARSGTEG